MTPREYFAARMGREGVPPGVIACVLRYAATIYRLATAECNRPLTTSDRHRYARTWVKLMGTLVPYKCDAHMDALVLKIRCPSGAYDSWGQDGLCVPRPKGV